MHNEPIIDKRIIIEFLNTTEFFDVPIEGMINETIIAIDLDSLQILNLSYELEKKFGLKINLEKLSTDTTLNDILENLISVS
jgi:acyl carrier protein